MPLENVASGQAERARDYQLVLRLALGESVHTTTDRWQHLFSTAGAESCLPLCWERSAPFIRENAPSEIVARWRRAALRVALQAEERIALLGEVLRILEPVSRSTTVLKGIPLSQRLYRNAALRPTQDLDVYVAAEDREGAREVLRGFGWELSLGAAPFTEVFLKPFGVDIGRVEVHSLLFGEELRHLPAVAPSIETVMVKGLAVPALGSPALPAFLAVHLVRHEVPPLLWLIDLHTLWSSLSATERVDARRWARHARVEGYLSAMLRTSSAAFAAATGNRRALRQLGVRGGSRRTPHPLWIATTRASNPVDALRAACGIILPVSGRPGRGIARWLLRRIARKVRLTKLLPERTLPISASPDSNAPEAALQASRHDFLAIVREVVGSGGNLWIAVRGSSMAPTIRPNSLVLLTPPTSSVAPGDVVLAANAENAPVLHRVRRVSGDTLVLRGDRLTVDDRPIRREDVVARATRVRVGTHVTPIAERAGAIARLRWHTDRFLNRTAELCGVRAQQRSTL